jgi:hypothetical protein
MPNWGNCTRWPGVPVLKTLPCVTVLENVCFHDYRHSHCLFNVLMLNVPLWCDTPYWWNETSSRQLSKQNVMTTHFKTEVPCPPTYFLSPNWLPWSWSTNPSTWQLFRRRWRCEWLFLTWRCLSFISSSFGLVVDPKRVIPLWSKKY